MADGLVTASYETDRALLDELRAAWPPGRSPLHANEGRSVEGADDAAERSSAEPSAAIRVGSRFAVAFVPDDDGWRSVPLAGAGGRWWLAAPGDGISAFVAGAPSASERAIGVDQTHASVVVGERVVVKWFRRIGPGPSRAATLLSHLAAIGYRGVPEPLGWVAWRTPAGEDLAVAQGDAYLPGARDGWEWVVERVEAAAATPHDPTEGRGRLLDPIATGEALGSLVAGLHRALATPTTVIPGPFASATRDEVDGWRRRAAATLEDAIALTDAADAAAGAELRAWRPGMERDLQAVATDTVIVCQPVHGDLHVGQILEWPGGLAIIDFDGNPALGPDANPLRQPVERDVAQLLTSLDHAGRIVERRRGGDPDPVIAAWVTAARAGVLDAYGAVEAEVLAAFEVEQECRELVYAARFLPRWRPAPMATLRARYGR